MMVSPAGGSRWGKPVFQHRRMQEKCTGFVGWPAAWLAVLTAGLHLAPVQRLFTVVALAALA